MLVKKCGSSWIEISFPDAPGKPIMGANSYQQTYVVPAASASVAPLAYGSETNVMSDRVNVV